MIKNTGIIVSEEHCKVALARARGVLSTPVIKVDGAWLPDEARLNFGDWLDALAQSYGLPPPEVRDGETYHYGMTMKSEFTKWEGEEASPGQDILGT